MTLLAVPNFSEGRDLTTVQALRDAFAHAGALVLDVHVDPDHDRSVFSLAAEPGTLAGALVAGARVAAERIDMTRYEGAHPSVGALDVAPIVHVDPAARGAACVEALVTADEIARQAAVPVLLYGALADGRTRAELRRGGLRELARRLERAELTTDFGPARPHAGAGVTLVAARPPLVAFNLELAPAAGAEEARAIAAAVRDGGVEGIGGVRAIGVWLAGRGVAQVSFNVEDPAATPLSLLVDAVRRHAPVSGAELVGLASRAALTDFPDDVPIRGFDPANQVIENALGL